MADNVSLSIEESNKLRASLGLKALKVSRTIDSKTNTEANIEITTLDDDPELNYKLHKLSQEKDKNESLIKLKLSKSKTQRQSKILLKGITLADEDNDNNAEWINRLNKNKPKVFAKTDEIIKSAYTSSDLAGISIAHSLDDIIDNGETILVIEDSYIDNDDAGRDSPY